MLVTEQRLRCNNQRFVCYAFVRLRFLAEETIRFLFPRVLHFLLPCCSTTAGESNFLSSPWVITTAINFVSSSHITQPIKSKKQKTKTKQNRTILKAKLKLSSRFYLLVKERPLFMLFFSNYIKDFVACCLFLQKMIFMDVFTWASKSSF